MESPPSAGTDDVDGAVDIVVVSYETPELLEGCLRSVAAFGGPSVGSVLVVDNSVSDDCASVVRAKFPQVRLVRPTSNVGYGSAANLGVASCSAAAVLVLNADTTLTTGAIEAMRSALAADPATAVVGPRLVDDAGRAQASCATFPTVPRVFVHESGLWKLLGSSATARAWRPFLDPGRPALVPWVLGAALMIRRQPFEAVRGFDPAYFMYFEEVDLCRRLSEAGANTRFCPAAVVHHIGGASTSTVAPAMQRALYRSLATYTGRHGGRRSVVALRCVLIVVAMLRAGRDVTRDLFRRQPHSALDVARSWTKVAGDAARGWDP